MSNNFAEVSPNPLTIIIPKENNDKKVTNLILKNITNNYLVYKFLINTKGVLHAKPPTSFIKPSQSLSIEVNILNNNLPLEDYKRTKLLIMFFKVDEEIKTIEQAKKKYQELKNQETEKQEILVNLKIFSENDEGGPEEENENKEDEDEKVTYINYAQLKTELNDKNNEIKKNLEIQRKKLENLINLDKKNNNVKNEGKRKKYYNLDNLILVFIILIGLIIGANFACGYNKIFKKNN